VRRHPIWQHAPANTLDDWESKNFRVLPTKVTFGAKNGKSRPAAPFSRKLLRGGSGLLLPARPDGRGAGLPNPRGERCKLLKAGGRGYAHKASERSFRKVACYRIH
jgi:hypothetical protein